MLGLILLLPQSVQKLVRLGHDLGDQGVIVEVLDVKYLPVELEIVVCYLVNIGHKVLILQEEFEVFFVIASFWVVLGNIRHLHIFTRQLHIFIMLNNKTQ